MITQLPRDPIKMRAAKINSSNKTLLGGIDGCHLAAKCRRWSFFPLTWILASAPKQGRLFFLTENLGMKMEE